MPFFLLYKNLNFFLRIVTLRGFLKFLIFSAENHILKINSGVSYTKRTQINNMNICNFITQNDCWWLKEGHPEEIFLEILLIIAEIVSINITFLFSLFWTAELLKNYLQIILALLVSISFMRSCVSTRTTRIIVVEFYL